MVLVKIAIVIIIIRNNDNYYQSVYVFINSKENCNGTWLLTVLFLGDFSMRMVKHFDVTFSFHYMNILEIVKLPFCSSLCKVLKNPSKPGGNL